ncbi:radical SAM protein [Bacteroides thetaiotaomicron]|jgi:hypothetical protein|uniref:Pyrroloquinoline quinone biosynthesis protein PqqE n=1 Tax=Bacteroides thetaiotaomicron TaxID=818 RepID=A0A174P4T7_BACT4|nr:4Fe-4S cluster-binding domain-containing protein [Bacteroides thetaiotaomicron]MCS2645920.1 4Fe-4S cluster-binding domain-containing protein [Bacteroides thetaiotaomicron]CUP53798.1 pyrroloquinoline quinone biosynthesis protein PqqE [Bacteroides thetaiotaomicron]
MNLEQLVIPPKTIAFATTYQCNAACKNCCFSCNPSIKARLSVKDMKEYIDQALNFYASSLKVLVLTGGESFLLKDDLVEILEYGSSKGLVTRVVTNGYWAQSYQKAYNTLLNLREHGLKEINYSTGDDHQEWVPYENIVNGCIAAMDLNLTCVVNVETHDNSKFDGNTFFLDSRLRTYFDHTKYETPLKIEKGLWIPFNSESHITTDNIIPKEDISRTRCYSLFTTIPINPFSYMMSCCGLVSEHVIPFRLGSLKKQTVKELYEMQFNDLMKIWLYTEGPYNILKYIYEKRGIDRNISGHICAICAEIFRENENIQCVKDNYEELFASVMFKYLLLKRVY